MVMTFVLGTCVALAVISLVRERHLILITFVLVYHVATLPVLLGWSLLIILLRWCHIWSLFYSDKIC